MAVRPHDPDGGPDDDPHDEEQGTAPDADVDREWQAIVARLRATQDGADPAAAGSDPEVEDPTGPAAPAAPAWPGRPPGTPSPADPRAWSVDPEVEEQDTHFVPPDPGPVLGGDPLLTLAWGAVVGAPLLMLLSVTLWRSAPTVLLQVVGAVFVAGLGILLWRMPDRRHHDDGPGAVV